MKVQRSEMRVINGIGYLPDEQGEYPIPIALPLSYKSIEVEDRETYFRWIGVLIDQLPKDFHAIVALKRSGWIIGVVLSHALGLPVFSSSELKNMPKKYINVLVVDSVICTGKSINKISHKLTKQGRRVTTAVLIVARDKKTDYYATCAKPKSKMWYEL